MTERPDRWERLARSLARRYPEVTLFENPDERRDAVRTVQFSVFWAVPVIGVLAGLVSVLLDVAVFPTTRRWGVSDWFVQFVCAVPLYGAALYAVLWAMRGRVRRRLRRRLVAYGMPVCLHCGYDLRGQTEARCPECGRAFDARLLANERRDGRVPPGSGE